MPNPAPPHMFDADLADVGATPVEHLPYAPDLVTALPYAESELRQRVALAVGAASACWDNLEGAGVFESERARAIADDLAANVLRLTGMGAGQLGCATTAELRAELEVRERLGHTDPGYRTVGDHRSARAASDA